MDAKQSYNLWASQYDDNVNKTRDLEAICFRKSLSSFSFSDVLEIGCGTGKNTVWLNENAKHVTAVDLSDEMFAKAKEKIKSNKVEFVKADITNEWKFTNQLYDLICFSLVLEHIENLDHIFYQANKKLKISGIIYVGELHPYKQYTGSKAKFETGNGTHVVKCFNHHISDFTQAAKANGLKLIDVKEYFDDNDKTGIPRILSILLRNTTT